MAAGADGASAPGLPLDRSVHWERRRIDGEDDRRVSVTKLAMITSDDGAHTIVGIERCRDSRLLWRRTVGENVVPNDIFPIVSSEGVRVIALAIDWASILMMPIDEKEEPWVIAGYLQDNARLGAYCEVRGRSKMFWSAGSIAFVSGIARDRCLLTRRAAFDAHTREITSLDATADKGRILLATASADHTVRLWNGSSLGRTFGPQPAVRHDGEVKFVAFLPRADEDEPLRALSLAAPLVARVWSVEDRATIFESTGRPIFSAIVRLAWAPSGANVPVVLSFDADDELKMWRPDEDGEVITLGEGDDSWESVACGGSTVAWLAREHGRQYIAIAHPAPRNKAARA
jgi:WD40 repeat protein